MAKKIFQIECNAPDDFLTAERIRVALERSAGGGSPFSVVDQSIKPATKPAPEPVQVSIPKPAPKKKK